MFYHRFGNRFGNASPGVTFDNLVIPYVLFHKHICFSMPAILIVELMGEVQKFNKA